MIRWSVRRRSSSEPLGRFGGGWQWNLGVQASAIPAPRGTIIVNLVTLSVRVDWKPS